MAPKTVPDENDILYDTYSIDLIGALRALIEHVLAFLQGGGGVESAMETLTYWWNVFSIIALLLSALFIAGFIYAKIRSAQLAEIETKRIREAEQAWAHAYGNGAKESNRWNDIEQHVASENPNDWRLGIIEADILLEEALAERGYVGASVGDKLKTVNPGTIRSLQDAWDAHLVRNRIAHTGSDFILTKRMANEAIIKYKRFLTEVGAL